MIRQVTGNIKEMLDTTLANILKPVTEMSEKPDKIVDRLGAVEQRVSDLEDNAAANTPRLELVESVLKKAMEKLENYENQSWRQNFRIIGLKEGKNPPVLFKKLIPEVLNMDMQGDRLKIEQAHHVGPPVGSTGRQGPHTVLRLHDYTDRQRILQAARNRGRVSTDGQVVSFYQDFSGEIVKRQQESADTRRRLQEAVIKYAFVYPAVIKVLPPNGKPISLPTMKEINDYVKTLPTQWLSIHL